MRTSLSRERLSVFSGWPIVLLLVGLAAMVVPASVDSAQDEAPKRQDQAAPAASQASKPAESKKPVVITSENMEADNRAHKALFTGNVVAQTEASTIYADRMSVLYDGPSGRIDRIDCKGSVKVVRGERVILSEEATYFKAEDKMVFMNNPRILDGQNLVTGSIITYFQTDDRLIVEKSRVFMPPK